MTDKTVKLPVRDESKTVGTVTLAKAGRHTLTVTPLTKPGPAVMDLREVVLRPAK